ncbi:MAG: hypothetical protein GEV12_08540 [Micromonosporaceae bacterium]|nr:hypothetical protein [Micromonosporaceae bacterium]
MTATQEMACQQCHKPLNSLDDTYIHPLGSVADGHEPVPVPAIGLDTIARRCDFCGDPYPAWTLASGEVAAIALGQTGGLVQNYGDRWAACTACELLVGSGRIEPLVDRATAALGLRRDPAGRHRIAQLHAAFLHTRQPGRTLITTTAWPANVLTARDLPRIRDRLTHLCRGGDTLPGQLGDPELRRTIAEGLDQARLYWIDPEFTVLADHAADQLPETTIDPEDLPAADGLLVWASPVHDATIAAASWTTQPHGYQLVSYRSIGRGLDNNAAQHLREQVGWLVPMRTATVGPRQPAAGRGHTAALVATWLLIAQKVTETIPADLGRAIRKAYSRQRRPAPEVRIVRIKPRPHTRGITVRRGASHGGREPLLEREWVGEHWKQQPYGPGRSRRKLIYVAPYLRGPDDQPIRASSSVRVLGTTRTHTPREDKE